MLNNQQIAEQMERGREFLRNVGEGCYIDRPYKELLYTLNELGKYARKATEATLSKQDKGEGGVSLHSFEWQVKLMKDGATLRLIKAEKPEHRVVPPSALNDITKQLETGELSFTEQGKHLKFRVEGVICEGVPLGNYNVSVGTGGHVWAGNESQTWYNPRDDEHVHHPHISNYSDDDGKPTGGGVCMGGFTPALKIAMRRGDMMAVADLVTFALNSYDPDSHYSHIGIFGGGECEGCGAGAPKFRCMCCDQHFCGDCLTKCNRCRSTYCAGCADEIYPKKQWQVGKPCPYCLKNHGSNGKTDITIRWASEVEDEAQTT